MKRRDLIKKIEAQGAALIRHGGKHDWYQNPATPRSQVALGNAMFVFEAVLRTVRVVIVRG